MSINYDDIQFFQVREHASVQGSSILGNRASEDKNPELSVTFNCFSDQKPETMALRKDAVAPIIQKAEDKGFLTLTWIDDVTAETVTQFINPNGIEAILYDRDENLGIIQHEQNGRACVSRVSQGDFERAINASGIEIAEKEILDQGITRLTFKADTNQPAAL